MTATERGLLVSDFNIQNLSSLLNSDSASPQVETKAAPFGQLMPILLQEDHLEWLPRPDFTVVWSRPESAIDAFRDCLRLEPVETDLLLSQVDAYCNALLAAGNRTRAMIVPTWTTPPNHQGRGIQDLGTHGVARAILRLNERLLSNLDGHPNVNPLHTDRWIQEAGREAYSARLWYMGKIPFHNDVFRAAVRDIKSALRGLRGHLKKVVVLDLDETLWGGILGDVGMDNIVLGGHDPAGEALVDFQHELKALTKRGVLLAVVSKNDEETAMRALAEHPEMVLRPKDLSAWRINWQDKAQNVADILTALNLGLDSAVFIDDNPVERARVREALPEVYVPDWPKDKKLYPSALLALDCFDSPMLSEEDRNRHAMYATERRRKTEQSQVGNVDEWLKTLGMVVTVEPLSEQNLPRTVQLLNKTNQMNLSTRRMTAEEYVAWAADDDHSVWAFRVSDKYGDSGLTGILGLEEDGRERIRIADFVLSCRVMCRGVEETILFFASEWARKRGAAQLYAIFRPTKSNKPCHEFLEKSGLKSSDGARYSLDLSKPFPNQAHIELRADSLGGEP